MSHPVFRNPTYGTPSACCLSACNLLKVGVRDNKVKTGGEKLKGSFLSALVQLHGLVSESGMALTLPLSSLNEDISDGEDVSNGRFSLHSACRLLETRR